jgi:SAM-dependent methyltransferase
MRAAPPGWATADELRELFDVERELAGRLRAAGADERRSLYAEVYRERSVRLPQHPLVQQAADSVGRAASVAPQVRLLRRFADPATTFVEVGAGDGAVAKALAPSVAHAIAYDVTDALFGEPVPPNFEYRTFAGFELDLPTGTADLVYSNDVVEHLHPDDLRLHAGEVRRILRSGGRYVCVTPNALSGPHDVSRWFADEPVGFHLREYTATELAGELRAAGFASVSVCATWKGRSLTPVLPAAAVRPVEAAAARLPRARRVRLAPALAAIKVVARA